MNACSQSIRELQFTIYVGFSIGDFLQVQELKKLL